MGNEPTSYPGHETAFPPWLHLLSGEVEAEKDKVYSGNETGERTSLLEEQPDVHPQGIRRPCDRFTHYYWDFHYRQSIK